MKLPPNWKKILNNKLIEKTLNNEVLLDIIKKAQKEYVYWDKFKYYNFPKDIQPEEAWSFLKFTNRIGNTEKTPIKTINKDSFVYNLPNILQQKLSFIDIHSAGNIESNEYKPNEAQKTQLIISGFSEEAIASSQIEGANTSRKVAKEMILSGRKARTLGEKMIINNYNVMQKLQDWKNLDLSKKMLLEIQKLITLDTLEDPRESGRFRKNKDKIVVSDAMTGEIVFTPPTEKVLKNELNNLIKYANKKEGDGSFVHPVIKAIILHFWIAYLHPFVDGNGRTARAIFYWYLLKNDYWLFQYLSVSKIIKISRKKYDEAFLHSEYDDNDLTYFLLFITKSIEKSISEFQNHYNKKIKELEELTKISKELRKFNNRQIALLLYFDKHKEQTIDTKTHQNKHGITYETARSDLFDLTKKKCLVKVKQGNKFIFTANKEALKKFIKNI